MVWTVWRRSCTYITTATRAATPRTKMNSADSSSTEWERKPALDSSNTFMKIYFARTIRFAARGWKPVDDHQPLMGAVGVTASRAPNGGAGMRRGSAALPEQEWERQFVLVLAASGAEGRQPRVLDQVAEVVFAQGRHEAFL